ncbi:MAG: acyl-CoA synthetase [Deltaproteobacteria bacterium]|nr:acyl-CoA synthetase [Deltaproteobacteria bacterium]MBW2387613.1 acyl-CoA synthetase [Deltaproteobacteria bacterium]
MYNLAILHEAVARAIPERECLVFRDRRFTWEQVTDRTRRLAAVLKAAGLGCHTEREQLANWESGQDHIGLYLYNGNEYLEGMLGAFKARCAPFNVNYRYVEKELFYLFENAKARAIIYHAAFAPVLEKLRDQLPNVRLWLQVADDSGNALLPGAIDYEAALAAASPEPLSPNVSQDDLYILYTGGTTGMPKGVIWRNEDIHKAALAAGGVANSLEELQERMKARSELRSLPSPPLMHGAAHWVAFNMWHVGATVVIQSVVERLDPDDIWSTVERERVNALTIVGDAFARPLLDQLEKKDYDLSTLALVTSGGAIFTAALKREFLERLPNVRIMDALGSSETGAQGVHFSTKDSGAATGNFDMTEGNVVLRDDLSGYLEPGSEEIGWLARKGHVPLGYYDDPDKTAKTFPVIDGVRYSVPGDRAMLEADGRLKLLGRDSVTINSGGEKIFAEEVELALKDHPGVYDVVVCGTPNARFGSQVTALVQVREGQTPSESELKAHAGQSIAAYKLPRAFVFVDLVTRAPSGKADYRWAKERAMKELGIESE